jgi:hypothetical protein
MNENSKQHAIFECFSLGKYLSEYNGEMNAKQHSSAGRTLYDYSGRNGHADPPSQRLKNRNMI